jgi:hypothetical protein
MILVITLEESNAGPEYKKQFPVAHNENLLPSGTTSQRACSSKNLDE